MHVTHPSMVEEGSGERNTFVRNLGINARPGEGGRERGGSSKGWGDGRCAYACGALRRGGGRGVRGCTPSCTSLCGHQCMRLGERGGRRAERVRGGGKIDARLHAHAPMQCNAAALTPTLCIPFPCPLPPPATRSPPCSGQGHPPVLRPEGGPADGQAGHALLDGQPVQQLHRERGCWVNGFWVGGHGRGLRFSVLLRGREGVQEGWPTRTTTASGTWQQG